MQSTAKYLRIHAAAETRLADALPGPWEQVLVVPAYREDVGMLDGLLRAAGDGRTLIILVVNRPGGDADTAWGAALLDALGSPRHRQQHLTLHGIATDVDVLVVDRCVAGPPLRNDEGVGGARKIGADLACRLIADGRVKKPWIFNTDADAVLPVDYFAAIDVPDSAAACVYPFEHTFADDHDCRWPALLYEWHLHHYVNGLRRAGSPYAWHTVGSTIAVRFNHYAAVRGFPRRRAGEDFYLLNKLAKTGDIASLSAPIIRLQARRSDRVPFGTGPATARIAALAGPEQFRSYAPASFDYLGMLLRWLERAAEGDTSTPEAFVRNGHAPGIDARLFAQACADSGALAARHRALAASQQAEQRRRHLHQWFDAFRTLKWLHALRETVHSEVNAPELLRHDWYRPLLDAPGAPLPRQLAHLMPRLRDRLADGNARGALFNSGVQKKH